MNTLGIKARLCGIWLLLTRGGRVYGATDHKGRSIHLYRFGRTKGDAPSITLRLEK